MENLIFEILKMAGFIVVLFLCCLWLVKDKRSFYKFRDDSTDWPGRICNLLHRLLGSWDERIADNLGGPFFFVHVSHVFPAFGFTRSQASYAYKRDLYVRFFYYSLCGISGQLSGRFAIVRQTIPVLAEIKTLYPERQLYLFRFERRSCSFGGIY